MKITGPIEEEHAQWIFKDYLNREVGSVWGTVYVIPIKLLSNWDVLNTIIDEMGVTEAQYGIGPDMTITSIEFLHHQDAMMFYLKYC